MWTKARLCGILGSFLLTLALLASAVTLNANATTVSENGFKITMPTSATIQGSAKATVTASVKAIAGSRKKLVSDRITAYQGTKRVASGSKIKLGAGTYFLTTTVTWKQSPAKVTHTFTTARQRFVVSRRAAPVRKPATHVSCHPLTNSGNCYSAGERCRDSDHGVKGVAGNGESIECEDNNGWRWEPV